MGCIASGVTQVNENMMLAAAQAVAAKLSRADLAQGSILPDTKRIRRASGTVIKPCNPIVLT